MCKTLHVAFHIHIIKEKMVFPSSFDEVNKPTEVRLCIYSVRV